MPIVGVKCIRGKVEMKDCEQCRCDPLHQCGYPTELITFMLKKETEEPDGLEHSPSRILGCHRRAILEAREDCYFDVDYAYASLRGTLIHTGLEHVAHTDSTVAEKRVTTMVDTDYGPQPFQAKSDNIVILSEDEDDVHIKVRDWKTTGEIGHDFLKADIKHQMQVNCYAYVARQEPEQWLGRKKNVIVDELEVQYFGFTKPRRFTSKGSLPVVGKKPRGGEAEMLETEPIRVLPMYRVEAFIRKSIERRMRERQAATLPPPLEGEAAKWCFRCPVFAACKREG